MSRENCLFCKIIAGEIASSKVYEDAVCFAFNDISPQAPHHVLIVPREHFASLDKAEEKHRETLGHLLLTAANIAREKGFAADGYRTVINTNAGGGQTVFHLHVHLLGGRSFVFPPG
ncbi:MAG TPA: histidine triad nucleotide-binding protein [Pyrinomonadaceae bacterium]|nr:histidine triad nucleotide-binding protein [Pyrinomonadaceae bacterium]